jgi:hypothetical protein
MASHEPFGNLQHNLWSKGGPGVKLAVWFPTTKSRESTWSPCVQVECDTPLEGCWKQLQLCFRPHPNWSLSWELWTPKVPKVQTGTISRLLLGSPWTKSHLDVSFMGERREYYMGEGGGFPQLQAMVSQVSACCPWFVPTPRLI